MKIICTNRNFEDDKSVERIEVDELGNYFWTFTDYSTCEGVVFKGSFPCVVEDVKAVFRRAGREFDESRL